MGNIVAKFGGTSVKTDSAIRQLTEIVKNNSDIAVIVVSAVGGVTNLLVDFCQSEKELRQSILANILDTHLALANKLNLSVADEIKKKLVKVDKLKHVDKIDKEMTDDVLSLGEELSSLIVHAFLKLQGFDIKLVDIRKYIITDEHFGKAAPNLDLMNKNFKSFPQGLVITQGFIGSTADGRATTLGRGGSDYSAALIAEVLCADELLIYTDVAGVYTMDPNVVKEAIVIDELNFQEMAEMANFGAKVLHPATLEPCVRKKIPVRILSTFEPEKTGTLINVKEKKAIKPQIRAITMRKNQVLITIKSLKMLNAYGFLANIFSILAKYKISVDLITTSEVSVALTIDNINAGLPSSNPFLHYPELLRELNQFAEIAIEENLTLLAVIGSSLNLPGTIQKILDSIDSYMVRLVCYGASNSSISILVNKDNATEVARILHSNLLRGENV